MDRSLTEYIQQNKNTDREVHYTHVSCVRPKGRYAFGRNELEGFWNIYCERLANNPEMVSGMAELPQDYSMLVVDGDIKKKIVDVLRTNPEIKVEVRDGDDIKIKYVPVCLYTDEQIRAVIQAYQEVIQSVTKDWKPEHSVCIFLKKDPYIKDEYIKSGFHLAFINYFCSKPLQDTYLIPRVVDKVNEMEIFNDLGYALSSDVLDVSKKHSNAKPWLLYGSRKDETSGTYRADKAFFHGAEEVPLRKAFEGYKLYNGYEKLIEYESYENLVKLFPRVFSVNPCFRKTVEIIPMFDATANITFTEERPDRDDVKYDQTYEQQMATATELIELLDPSRAEKRDEWLEVGWILYSISNGSEDGMNLWIQFSQQSVDKFSLEVCLREWQRMYKGNHTLGSLKHFAKIDSPEEYEVFQRNRLEKMVSKAIDGSHNDLAKALYESYSTEYVCASLKPEMWFYYTDHHWEPMEEGIELRKKISDDLGRRYSKMIKGQFDQLADADDDDSSKKKESESKIATIYKLIKNLKNNSFKNSLMKECRELFYDRNFLKRLGKGKYLLALQNGVYDLQNHVFRAGKPEDYIAFQMPIVYREFNDLDPWVVETYTFFEKVFPDNSIREYVLDRLAELLVGGNKRKHVYFWTGRGNNGKSVMKSLIQRMFGPYFIDIPNSVLVGQKPKSGQACPELARADRGVRAAFTQEPNKNDLVNTGALKEYSGNDTFYARTLFEKGGEIDPMFKLVMITNDLPGVTTNDPAVWNRLRVIPFESTFTDNPPASEEEQFRTKTFLKDENFDEKLENMLEPLFWILTKRLPCINRVIYEPARVKEATEKYRRSQDVYAQFIDERMIPDDSKYINIMDFFQAFRDWHRQAFPGINIPNRNECSDYLTDVWGAPVNYRWSGWRLRTDRDDIADGRADENESVNYDEGHEFSESTGLNSLMK